MSDDFHEISKIVKIAHPAPDLGPHGRIFRQIRVLPHPGDGPEWLVEHLPAKDLSVL